MPDGGDGLLAAAPAVVRRRPAESGGVAGALAVLIAAIFGLDDPQVIVALAVVIGFVPAAVTWLVEWRRG